MSEQHSAREVERNSLIRLNNRAKKLVAADPRMSLSIARARAIEAMPNTVARHAAARRELAIAGIRPLLFEEL